MAALGIFSHYYMDVSTPKKSLQEKLYEIESIGEANHSAKLFANTFVTSVPENRGQIMTNGIGRLIINARKLKKGSSFSDIGFPHIFHQKIILYPFGK